ncbi:MAG: hypothetical protein PHD04_04450 [Candidatus Pacebacteria bacterium]|nr:hypothetical protein [Candidatus Paceibacterota bacterium]
MIISVIIGAITIAFLSTVLIATFYQAPSCTDGLQNQGEAGIDCGGSCAYLCAADEQPPTVLFAKALSNGAGRASVIASVENKNASVAAKDVPYRVRLYGAGRSLIQEVTGTLDLPPGATIPVFIPSITSGKQVVVATFFDIDPSSPKWFQMSDDPRILPRVSSTKQGGTSSAPRIEATLVNSSTNMLSNVETIVLVRDEKGDVIAASRTIVSAIPAGGQSTATFTWNSAFPGIPASIEVVPVIPLP